MPGLQDWLTALAARFTLIQMDFRGAGMSTRGLPEDLAPSDYQRDIQAVVSALKLDRFVLSSSNYHLAYFAVQYAVEQPERVKALVLAGVGTSLAAFSSPALFETVSGQNWDLFWNSLIAFNAPNLSLEERQRIVDLNKQAYDPHDYPLMAKVMGSANLAELLPRLTSPTLILHLLGWRLLAPEEPMKVARLARAKLVSIDGNKPTSLDPVQGLHAIEAFLADLPSTPSQPAVSAAGGLPDGLSSREVEVLRLLAQGKSNPEIAKELFITRNTVQNHVGSILIKTNLNNRTEAAVYAKEHGLIKGRVSTPLSQD
jgi:DNA-binding CsgD family transcriptional regulator